MTNRVIVITGGSDGIRAAAARLPKDQGAHVAVVGRSLEETEMVARELGIPYYLADRTKLDDARTVACRLRTASRRRDKPIKWPGILMRGSNCAISDPPRRRARCVEVY